MNPSEKAQSNYTAQWTDVSLKNEEISSCKETTESNGHLVKQVPPIPSTLQQDMPPSSFDLFDEKTRPHHSGLPGIRIITGELSGRSAQQSPELTPGEISHSHQRILPSATINKPDDQATKALRDKLIKLAGIPNSTYQRQFPNHTGCDTRNVSSYLRSEPIRNMVKDIMYQYQLWEDREFKDYLQSNKLSGAFNPESFMWDIPFDLLEIVVHYIFQEDHILRNVSFTGAHGYMLSYRDHEILTEHKPVRSEFIRKIEIKYTHNEKPIIQQQATRGCSYAAAAMLIHQHNRCFSVSDLKSTNLGDDSFIFQALSNAGLSPFQTRFANLEELASAVKQDGSAIVAVNSGMGGHSIVVDAVTDTSVLIRDPFHGWEVEIGRAAFAKSWNTDNNAIQVR